MIRGWVVDFLDNSYPIYDLLDLFTGTRPVTSRRYRDCSHRWDWEIETLFGRSQHCVKCGMGEWLKEKNAKN